MLCLFDLLFNILLLIILIFVPPFNTNFQIIIVSNGYKSRACDIPPAPDETTEDEEDHFSELNAPSAANKRERLCNQLLELIPAFGQLKYIQDTITLSDLGNRELDL